MKEMKIAVGILIILTTLAFFLFSVGLLAFQIPLISFVRQHQAGLIFVKMPFRQNFGVQHLFQGFDDSFVRQPQLLGDFADLAEIPTL